MKNEKISRKDFLKLIASAAVFMVLAKLDKFGNLTPKKTKTFSYGGSTYGGKK